LRARVVLACGLLLLALAAGGTALGAGCLVTDPVPYEPAENIPPIILPTTDPAPQSLVQVVRYGENPVTSLDFYIDVLEYNLGDTLYFEQVYDNCTSGTFERRTRPAPESTDGRRRRYKFTVSVNSAALLGKSCVRLILSVSDRGWSEESPPYCKPATDDQGEPQTVVSSIVWWIWLDDGSTTDGPGVATCGQ
jgi:hypothetical protein